MQHVTPFGFFILAASAAYHWPIGILSMVSVRITRKLARALYALDLPENLDPRYEYTWKPLGAYALFTAAIATDALLNTDSPFSAHVLKLLAALYLLRAALRWMYRDLFKRAYGVGLRRNLVNIFFNILLASGMLLYGTP